MPVPTLKPTKNPKSTKTPKSTQTSTPKPSKKKNKKKQNKAKKTEKENKNTVMFYCGIYKGFINIFQIIPHNSLTTLSRKNILSLERIYRHIRLSNK